MKLGMKEFRERIRELTERGEPVMVTNHGRRVATYLPRGPRDLERARKAAESVRRWQEEMKAKGVDLEGILADIGLDPYGEPLDDNARR